MRHINWRKILTATTCVLAVYFSIPNFINLGSYFPKNKINYGLDLRGGSQLLLKVNSKQFIADQYNTNALLMKKELRKNQLFFSNFLVKQNGIKLLLKDSKDFNALKKIIHKIYPKYTINQNDKYVDISLSMESIDEIKEHLIDQTKEIIRLRIDETGTLDPSIQKQGVEKILLQVPGLSDPKKIKRILGRTAKLSFNIVSDIVDINDNSYPPVGFKKLSDINSKVSYITKSSSILTGDFLNDENATVQNGAHVVSFEFNSIGAKIFGDITKNNRNRKLAIVLDDKVISAPNINEPIMGGSGVIQGGFTAQSASELALLLRAGALPAPLDIVEERIVGPTLGQDSIENGKVSSVVAIIAVVVFMIALYGLYGVFASFALGFNLLLLISLITLFQATLTLPGIAGIVLTMGMAVDANVLIFERIKEELSSSKSPNYSVNRGFDKAYATILDSNITTLIAAFFLYIFGTGIVKSFAITLTIGILASMFTAITLTKEMIVTWVNLRSK